MKTLRNAQQSVKVQTVREVLALHQIHNTPHRQTVCSSHSTSRRTHGVEIAVVQLLESRFNIAANVSDYTGAAVDTQRLTPGVYLATTTKRIQLFDPIKPWVTCTARELLTVPLATSPFASINPRLSKTTA